MSRKYTVVYITNVRRYINNEEAPQTVTLFESESWPKTEAFTDQAIENMENSGYPRLAGEAEDAIWILDSEGVVPE